MAGVAEVVARYLPSLRTLRDHDEARTLIDEIRSEFPADALFGGERGDALRGVVATIYQGSGGVHFYPTVQDKAVNLLFLVLLVSTLCDGA